MIPDWLLFLGYTFLCIFVQGFFALFEMAAVSVNKVRLKYDLSLNQKRAVWLHYLLSRPSRLFGTTLIGINAAMQIGSECSRQFYEALSLDPSWAPVSQVVLVVMLAELAPLFAARRHPDQLAMALVPFMVAMARLFTPMIWIFDALSKGIHKLMGRSEEVPLFFSREEVKVAFEDKRQTKDELSFIVSRIFALKNQTVETLMSPLSEIQMLSSLDTIHEAKHRLSVHYQQFIPIYHRIESNVVGIAHMSDLLSLKEGQKLLDHTRSPWFIPKGMLLLDVLDPFRRNNQIVAVVVNDSGAAFGFLTLDQILTQIFGEASGVLWDHSIQSVVHFERTLSADLPLSEFNRQFFTHFEGEEEECLSDFLIRLLDHSPVKGESIQVDRFFFTILEVSLAKIKTVTVKTLKESIG